MRDHIINHVLSPQLVESLTLEDFIERSLVHLFARKDFENSISLLKSDDTAKLIFNYLLEHLERCVEIRSETPVDVTRDVISEFIGEIIDNYDGFDKTNHLFGRLKELLENFPYKIVLNVILERADDFIAKITALIKFITEKKRTHRFIPAINQFVYDFGTEKDALNLLDENLSITHAIENTLEFRKADIELVMCGEGGRFKCYRVKLRKKGKIGVGWDYSDLVIKVMKDIVQSRTGMAGIFQKFKKEHELVEQHWGNRYVPPTYFKDPKTSIEEIKQSHPELKNYLVYQEYVNGESILGACKDPFLSQHLADVLPAYIKIYEEMENIHQKVIDCWSIAKRNVLVRRRLNDQDELTLWIVDTNNLTEVNSQKYRKFYIDRHTGQPHYLERLREFVRNKCLPENYNNNDVQISEQGVNKCSKILSL